MSINILDTMIINRISAGEVVESPFSIVKELIDNSLDAGADKIHIEIRNGGIDYISIKDNGKGIDKSDLKKAFYPHATSKIKDITDLEAIMTLGFRGEALASISNVSQTKLVSKTADSDCAYSIEVNGGEFFDEIATSGEIGTKIEVKNLFFNTPARRKFLKKPKTEENQITNIIARFILAHPEVSFTYIADGKKIYQSSGKTLLDAIFTVYGVETTQNIMPIDKTIGNYRIQGYVSKLGFSKPNTTYQTLILNNRYIIDEIVSKATYSAYEEYLMPRQFPFYVLNLTMPNIDVDVNVHPSKMNVKFSNPSKIYELVYSAIRSAIYEFLNPTQTTKNDLEDKEIDIKDNLIKTDLNSLKEITVEPNYTSNVDISSKFEQAESFSPITIFDLNKETKQDNKNIDYKSILKSNSHIQQDSNQIQETIKMEEKVESKDFVNVQNLVDYKVIGTIFNEFLVIEKNDNIIFLDYHAGHERLNYDKFTQMVNNREVVIQDLLVPYVQKMSRQEVEFVLNLKDELTALGFDIDEYGDDRIKINSIPMQLKDINLKNFVDDMLHDMKNIKPTMNNEIRHYLMQKACKSSVKAGMSLSDMEIRDLLKDLDMKNPVLLCPHGRPIITVVSKAQVEKWFKRIV